MKLVLAFFMMFVLSAQADIIPVKNFEPMSYSHLTRQELTWMYTMKTRFWEDGTRITVFYMDNTSRQHALFCTKVLNINTERFSTMVNSYINSGNASYYRLANTPEEVARKVGLIPGAVGYLDDDTVVVNSRGYVNVIKISK